MSPKLTNAPPTPMDGYHCFFGWPVVSISPSKTPDAQVAAAQRSRCNLDAASLAAFGIARLDPWQIAPLGFATPPDSLPSGPHLRAPWPAGAQRLQYGCRWVPHVNGERAFGFTQISPTDGALHKGGLHVVHKSPRLCKHIFCQQGVNLRCPPDGGAIGVPKPLKSTHQSVTLRDGPVKKSA